MPKPRPDGVLRLRILSTDGGAVTEPVHIELRHRVLSDVHILREANAAAEVRIEGLRRQPQGVYRLSVRAASFRPLRQFVVIAASGDTILDLVLRRTSEGPFFDLDLTPELSLPDNFEDEWTAIADALDQQFFVRGGPLRAVEGVFDVFDDLVFPGPLFDGTLMAQSIVDQMEAVGAPGYAYAIVRNGRLETAAGVGDARTPAESDPLSMTHNTRMVSASLAKPVCAVATMQLVEDGTLSLQQKAYPFIQGAFPDVHSDVEEITIEQLLTHTSGVNNGSGGLSKLSDFPELLQQPTAKIAASSYHNGNYWFLACLIESAVGPSYIDYVQGNILGPMGIVGMDNQVDANPCLYYELGETDDGFAWGDFDTTVIGAYGWYASVIHWARFMAFFRYDQVLPKARRLQMINDPRTYFGFRHWPGQPRGRYYGHGGDFFTGTRGYRGGMMGFSDGVDAVLLVNALGAFDPETILIDAFHNAYA